MELGRYLDFTYFRGRVGLAAVLRALGLDRGDEVAVQAYTCDAVPEAVAAAGARQNYVDIDLTTLGMSASGFQAAITSRTRAVVVQHTFGIPAAIREIAAIAGANGIAVIEDCCHTLCSKAGGRTVGTYGVAAFYSWEWGKPIIAGTGGSLIVNDDKIRAVVACEYERYVEPGLARQARIAFQRRAHSLFYRPSLYHQVRRLYHLAGALHLAESNYNQVTADTVPKDYSMRMGQRQFRQLESELVRVSEDVALRRRIASEYSAALANKKVRLFGCKEGDEAVMARYPVVVEDKPEAVRRANELKTELSTWYDSAIHPLRGADLSLMGYEEGSCPNAEYAAQHVVSLPVNQRVTARDIAKARRVFE